MMDKDKTLERIMSFDDVFLKRIRTAINRKLGDSKDYSEQFERWWLLYPRRTAKAAAYKSWKRQRLDSEVDQVIKTTEAYKTTEQWTRDKGQFVPHPTTFLNQGRWEDEVEVEGGIDHRIKGSTPDYYHFYKERGMPVPPNIMAEARAQGVV